MRNKQDDMSAVAMLMKAKISNDGRPCVYANQTKGTREDAHMLNCTSSDLGRHYSTVYDLYGQHRLLVFIAYNLRKLRYELQ